MTPVTPAVFEMTLNACGVINQSGVMGRAFDIGIFVQVVGFTIDGKQMARSDQSGKQDKNNH